MSDDLYKTISNASTSTTSDGVAMTAGATAPSQGQQAGVVPEQQMWFQPFHSSRYDAQSRAILAAEIAQRMHTSYHATNNGAFASPDEHGFIHPKQPPSLVAIAVSVARDAIVQVERGELLVQAQGWDIGMLWCMVTGLGKKRVGDGKEDVKSRSRERLSEMVSLDAWNMGLRIVQGKSLRDVAREVGGMSEAQLLEFCAVGADQMPGQVQGGVHGQAMQGDWYAATSPGIARSDNGVGETWGNGPGPAVVGGSEDGQGWNTS